MTYSCWTLKLCRETVLSVAAAGLELRQPARPARCGNTARGTAALTAVTLHLVTTIK